MEQNTDRMGFALIALSIVAVVLIIMNTIFGPTVKSYFQGLQKWSDNVMNQLNPPQQYTHTAYSWSADGKDRFYVAGGTNLIVQSDLKPGWFDQGTGGMVDGANDFHSDNYIATNGGTVFTFSSPDYTFKGNSHDPLLMYDSNKNYLGCQLITSPTQTLSKSNVAYIRFSINFPDEGGTTGKLSDWLANHRYKLEKGSIATSWSPAPSDPQPKYIGTYTDTNEQGSQDPSKYTWTKTN